MAKTQRDPFQTIESSKLDTVSGGRSIARSGSVTASGGAGGDLMTTLTEIESSLVSLYQHQNPFEEMLQLFELMRGFTPKVASAAPAAAPAAHGMASTRATSAQPKFWRATKK